MQRQNNDLNLNIGTSSILFIFVILSLVSFAVLSLANAMSDYKLSSRISNNTTAYYNACNEAYQIIADADETFSNLYSTGISRSGYYEKVGRKKSFALPVTDVQTLYVEIKILYPDNPGDNFYELTSWKLVTTGDLEYDESLPVYKE